MLPALERQYRVGAVSLRGLGEAAGYQPLIPPDPSPNFSPIEQTFAGGTVPNAPLVAGALVERTAGGERFQVVQTVPATLRVRLRPDRAQESPEQSPGGKHREIAPCGGAPIR